MSTFISLQKFNELITMPRKKGHKPDIRFADLLDLVRRRGMKDIEDIVLQNPLTGRILKREQQEELKTQLKILFDISGYTITVIPYGYNFYQINESVGNGVDSLLVSSSGTEMALLILSIKQAINELAIRMAAQQKFQSELRKHSGEIGQAQEPLEEKIENRKRCNVSLIQIYINKAAERVAQQQSTTGNTPRQQNSAGTSLRGTTFVPRDLSPPRESPRAEDAVDPSKSLNARPS